MAARKRGKLNQLERLLPDGLLADAAWLSRHGYSTSLLSQYVGAGWLQHPSRQVYRRSRNPVTWQQAVVSLQTLLLNDLVVGGRSALQMQGFAHYWPIGDMRKVYLYGPQYPPAWLGKLPLETAFVYRNNQRLFRHPAGIENHGLAKPVASEKGRVSQPWEGWELILSCPERALLELLDELPNRETFHEVDMALEGLTSLSPRRLEILLLDCRSVKVKRLFFFLADRHQHGWFKHIKTGLIDLGKGKRMLVQGGKLDPRYQITVPEDL
jgi:hypothetical protein